MHIIELWPFVIAATFPPSRRILSEESRHFKVAQRSWFSPPSRVREILPMYRAAGLLNIPTRCHRGARYLVSVWCCYPRHITTASSNAMQSFPFLPTQGSFHSDGLQVHFAQLGIRVNPSETECLGVSNRPMNDRSILLSLSVSLWWSVAKGQL